METSVNNGIKKTVSKSAPVLSRMYQAQYQKEGTQTAEFKQTVTTVTEYPKKSVANNMKDNPIPMEEFGFGSEKYTNSSTRVAWIDVPSAYTEEKLNQVLAGKEISVQQTMSNHPIISDAQENGISRGVTTKDAIAESQILRYPEGSKNNAGMDVSGQIILDSVTRKPMYRVNYFRNGEVDDVDLRTSDTADFYLPESLTEEVTADMSDAAKESFLN